MGGVIFLLLWLMAFSVFTSLLTAAGCCVVVVAASAASDLSKRCWMPLPRSSLACSVRSLLLRRNIQSLRQLKGSRPRTGASLGYGMTFADAASMPCRDKNEVRAKANALGLVELREKMEWAPQLADDA
jgi:hypothetical protein